MKHHPGTRQLDVKAFAEAGQPMQRTDPLAALERLASEAAGGPGEHVVDWSVQGELRNAAHVRPDIWLHLRARSALPLTCQRCLAPVDTVIEVDRSYRFVADEATAQAQDDESEEDVMALDGGLDLMALLEDELLMSMPLVPRHETCPEQPPMSAVSEEFEASLEEKTRPFASLAAWKSSKDPSNQ